MSQNHFYLLSESKSDDSSNSTAGKNKWIAIDTSKLGLIYQSVSYCVWPFRIPLQCVIIALGAIHISNFPTVCVKMTLRFRTSHPVPLTLKCQICQKLMFITANIKLVRGIFSLFHTSASINECINKSINKYAFFRFFLEVSFLSQ